MPQSSANLRILPARTRLPRRHQLVALLAAFACVAGLGLAVSVGSSSAAPVYGPNLLNNSGFLAGLYGWQTPRRPVVSLARVDGGVLDSGHSLRVTAPRPVTARLADRPGDYPTAQAGANYLASAWVLPVRRSMRGALKVREWRGHQVVDTWVKRFTAVPGTWQRVWIQAQAHGDGDRLQVVMALPFQPVDRAVRVDRVMLRQVLVAGSGDPTDPPVEPGDDGDPPSPPQGDPGAATPSGTLFGASVYTGGASWSSALDAANRRYGRMDVVRVFYSGLPSAWPGRAGEVGGPVVVSFKASPDEVNSGKDDAFFRDWFASAPPDRDVWWTLWHEPEDDVAAGRFSAAAWRTAFRRLAALADEAGNPRLHNTVILMCWTVDPRSGRSLADFLPGTDAVDTIGWDCYSHPSDPRTYADPASMYGDAIRASRAAGVSWGIAETGSRLAEGDDGSKRAAWLRQVADYLTGQGASFVTYFDSVVGGEFRLLDEPSQQAWRDVVTRP